jgi:SpoVK/Ycf46/Vps4 family AAA+-type ATPase
MNDSELYGDAYHIFNNAMNMTIYSYFKTNNPVLDTIISTIAITFISYIVKILYFKSAVRNVKVVDYMKSMVYKRYSIQFEGKQSFVISKYDLQPTITTCFSDTFKALFYDIMNSIKNNDTIYEIKEYITSRKYNGPTEAEMYIISQERSYLYNKELEIYASTEIYSEDTTGDKNASKSSSIKTDIITITLFSYKTNIEQIQKHVEKVKLNYLEYIENVRNDKKFIYSLSNTSFEDSRYECWREYQFESSRTFDNMFFDGKEQIISKIRFFLDNKDWYYKNGIPYTLGIGLYGPPGTGKTSFFKSLANLTGRHLVILSFKLIKTKRQLEDFFYEEKYNENNKANSIGFDKKIIIIEDIDCIGDIVLKREDKKRRQKKIKDADSVGTAIQKLFENSEDKMNVVECKNKDDDPITLDDILNLWDGIKETPGRILGISSNHYDKLDPALTRPGRIDITLNLDNATRKTIQQMFQHFYGKPITDSVAKKIKDKFYSPAQLTNLYVNYKDDPDKFIECLTTGKSG